MRIRLLVIALVLLCVGVFLARSCSGGRRFVDRAVRHAQWSKDSRYLFYSKSEKKLFRYDVRTGNKQTYAMPDRLDQFAISPDGQYVMFPMVRNKTYAVYILDLNSRKIQRKFAMKDAAKEFTTGVDMYGKRRTALELLKRITSIAWPDSNSALLLVERPKGYSDVYLLDIGNNAFRELRGDVEDFTWTSDGSGFAYTDASKHYRIYNLSDRTDKPLDFGKLDVNEIGFLYISRHQIVFTYDKPKRTAKAMDLSTMAMRPISLPEDENISDISHDLSRCLTGSAAHPSAFGGWTSNKVYVMDLPEETVRQLRRLEHRPQPTTNDAADK